MGQAAISFRQTELKASKHCMRILMSSAEGPPMRGSGALVDVMDALPSALRDRGHEVSIALPFYREIQQNRAFRKKDTGITVDVQVGDTIHVARYLEDRKSVV